ncbi:hypothetical protein FKP32DRAFT_1671432 [Trametes sanguinea]|nr:hypothetical protein FKP32DRAFT_1671432 [Trametes sanguinea]
MTPHRALWNVDVWYTICEWARLIHDSENEGRRTLARLARVCKALHEPAVCVLWRELDSIFPIFLVLPSFVLRRENAEPSPQSTHEEFYDEYHLPANVPAHEWSRLRRYAAYVRSVTFRWRTYCPLSLTWGRMELSRQSWSSIQILFGDDPVFPNLEKLHWQIAEVDFEYGSLTHFLSPSLRSLDLNCQVASRFPVTQQYRDSWSAHLRQLMSEVSTRSPNISSLTFFYGGSLTPAQFFDPLALTPPPSLRALTIVGPTDKAITLSDLQILSTVPNLESLTFEQELEFDDSPAPGRPRRVTFPHLRHLQFASRCMPNNCMYTMFASTNLQTLCISAYRFLDASSLQHDCVVWALSFPSLIAFICRFTRTQPPGPDETLLYVSESISALFAPLLSMRNILTFSVNLADLCVPIDDRDLTTFSQSWPSLWSLSITASEACVANMPNFTIGLQGLLSLARNCPRLAVLHLETARIDPETFSEPASELTPTHRALRNLQVRDGLAPEAHRFLVENVFPSLSAFNS